MKVKIQKFLANEASFGEKRELLKWLAKNNRNKEVFIQEVQKWNENYELKHDFDVKNALEEFKAGIGYYESGSDPKD